MTRIRNGMPATDLPHARWHKSRRSGIEGNCVEMARLPGGNVAVRNSRNPAGPVLIYSRREIARFVVAAKDGNFDSLLSKRG
ncbi:MAG: DUF397 domain-containing protein [Carbonactinosporaceae bacterium]